MVPILRCQKYFQAKQLPTMVNVPSTKSNSSKFQSCDLGEEQMLDRFERLKSVAMTDRLPVLVL